MKKRTPEALRLEDDYFKRVREAMINRVLYEDEDVLQSIRDHIEEALASEKEPVGLAAIAAVLERLGPPENFAREEAAQQEAQAPPPAPAMISPLGGPTVAECFSESAEMYKKNFVTLLLASIIFTFLSLVTLTVLVGPLIGGFCLMFLNALKHPEKKMDLGDMFRAFNRFWPLLAVAIIQLIFVTVGWVLLILPGVFLMTIWMYCEFFVVQYGQGTFESLGSSYRLVSRRFGWNIGVGLIILAISLGPSLLPGIGNVASIVFQPFGWLFWAFTYVRQMSPEVVRPPLQVAAG